MNVEPIDLRDIDKVSANVYEATIVSAKRARQVNDEQKMEFNAMLNTIPPSAGEEEGEDIQNPAQLKFALDFETREKPHLQALKELLDGNVGYEFKT